MKLKVQWTVRRRRWILLGSTLVAISTVGYLAVGEPLPGTRSDESAGEAFAAGDVAADERILPVEVTAVERATGFEVADRFLGRVEVARASDLGFELSGTLLRVLVEEGVSVSEGQVLARLDTDRLEAREAELGALVDQAEAARELGEKTWDRIRRLVEKQAASQQDLDNATEQKRRANAGLRQARAQLEAVRVDLAKIERGDDPRMVAKAVWNVLTARAPRLRYPVGKGVALSRMRRFVPAGMFDKSFRKQFQLD